ncbi:MAG: glycosyltransferase family 4 protein [Elusimicrobia bacterium]|nr:glycosyltransferase family 4 protein [Elusimicrobiota bacterium]
MKIGIVLIQGNTGGPRTYALNLIKGLLGVDRDNEYFILSDRGRTGSGLKDASWVEIPLAGRYMRPYWDNVLLPKALKGYKIDLLHDTRNVLPFRIPCRSVATIHDLAPFIYPGTFGALRLIDHHINMRNASRRADAVIVPSETTKDDLIRILGVPEKRINVIYEAADSAFKQRRDRTVIEDFRKKRLLPEKYLLAVGTTQKRKNIPLLVKGFLKAKTDSGFLHHLVIAGRGNYAVPSGFVHFLKDIEDGELPLLYAAADIFVSLSLYEGFGLAVLEALASGLPVLTYRNKTAEEVAAGAAEYIESLKPEDIAGSIASLISDGGRLRELKKQSSERAALYSWEQTAIETLEVYRKVLNGDIRNHTGL